jgi:hypothetical protein
MHPTDKAARVAGALYLLESRRPPGDERLGRNVSGGAPPRLSRGRSPL